ncbi:hypothetical protein FGB62_2g024 [Gracilaria domingensis]|nr:hypothetical protein FGB62_2g024 [Gracilaria domingensis]
MRRRVELSKNVRAAGLLKSGFESAGEVWGIGGGQQLYEGGGERMQAIAVARFSGTRAGPVRIGRLRVHHTNKRSALRQWGVRSKQPPTIAVARARWHTRGSR